MPGEVPRHELLHFFRVASLCVSPNSATRPEMQEVAALLTGIGMAVGPSMFVGRPGVAPDVEGVPYNEGSLTSDSRSWKGNGEGEKSNEEEGGKWFGPSIGGR